MPDQQVESVAQQYTLAQEAFLLGEFDDLFNLLGSALDRLRSLEQKDATLQGNIIRLLVAAADIKYRGQSKFHHDQFDTLALLDEGEVVVASADLPVLMAHFKVLRGNFFARTASVGETISELEEAVEFGLQSQDIITQYITLATLGHQYVKINLEKGISFMYQALSLFDNNIDLLTSESEELPPEMDRLRIRGDAIIGVAEFDRGNYDISLAFLERSVEGYRSAGFRWDLPGTLNYLAQVQLACGSFEASENALQEAISLIDEADKPNAWNGNNLALLGKLYIEWGRLHDAGAPLKQGLTESSQTDNIDLISLVRNYCAEYYLHQDSPERNLDIAENILKQNLEEAGHAEVHRSTIQALILLGLLELARNNTEAALRFSTEAVRHLESLGDLPALRSQEVFYQHYTILKENGSQKAAQKYLLKAYEKTMQITKSISNAQQRINFLHRVPVNHAIVSASED